LLIKSCWESDSDKAGYDLASALKSLAGELNQALNRFSA
jgi:hypothetical protein